VTRLLPMFPLSVVLFPRALLPLHVFEDRYRALMADCLGGDGEFGVVLISRGPEVGGGDRRVDVGTVARISHRSELEGGRLLVVAEGVRRVMVDRWLPDDPYPRAEVGDFPDGGGDARATAAAATAEAEAAVRRLRSLLSEMGEVPALPHDLDMVGADEEVGWQLCDLAPVSLIDRQQLLACADHTSRMRMLVLFCRDMADDVVALLSAGSTGAAGSAGAPPDPDP